VFFIPVLKWRKRRGLEIMQEGKREDWKAYKDVPSS
jgi:hypothetical protein